jgi:hypothetical protein
VKTVNTLETYHNLFVLAPAAQFYDFHHHQKGNNIQNLSFSVGNDISFAKLKIHDVEDSTNCHEQWRTVGEQETERRDENVH